MLYVQRRMDISIVFLCMPMMFVAVLSEPRMRLISAHHKPEYDNKYEDENAIDAYHVRSVGLCGMQCISNARCLSFFYNNLTRMCVLHSDPFTYTVMSSLAEGWKFYLSQERAGRCLVNFFYYRELDLCYKFGPPISVIDVYKEFACKGSELMRIDSDARQDYIKLVTADIGIVYDFGICIQGRETQGNWTYIDGSKMEYFRWLPNLRSTASNVIRMIRALNYGWKNSNTEHNCTYMCENRLQN